MRRLRGFGEVVLKMFADKYSTSLFRSGLVIQAYLNAIWQVVYTQELQGNHHKCLANGPSGIPKDATLQRVIVQSFVNTLRTGGVI